jgi:hypothetical protein
MIDEYPEWMEGVTSLSWFCLAVLSALFDATAWNIQLLLPFRFLSLFYPHILTFQIWICSNYSYACSMFPTIFTHFLVYFLPAFLKCRLLFLQPLRHIPPSHIIHYTMSVLLLPRFSWMFSAFRPFPLLSVHGNAFQSRSSPGNKTIKKWYIGS